MSASEEEEETKAPAVDAMVLGGAAAGKSLLVRHLGCVGRDEALKSVKTSSTTGVELDEVGQGSKRLALWEVGAPMTPNWHTYFGSSYMIIYVIDRSNPAAVSSAIIELLRALSHDKTRDVPVMLFLNKSDAKAPMSVALLSELIRLEDLRAARTAPIDVLEGSAKTGAGLKRLMQWMLDTKAACIATARRREP